MLCTVKDLAIRRSFFVQYPMLYKLLIPRSMPRALLHELRISGLCSMLMWTMLICLADVDITVVICASEF